MQYIFEALVILLLLTLLFWLLFAFDQSHRSWWVAVAIGPIGAQLRYFISHFNPYTPNFPVFTFIANILAVVCNIIIVGVHNSIAVRIIYRTQAQLSISSAILNLDT